MQETIKKTNTSNPTLSEPAHLYVGVFLLLKVFILTCLKELTCMEDKIFIVYMNAFNPRCASHSISRRVVYSKVELKGRV